MAPLPSKRRKLAHLESELESGDGFIGEQNDISETSESDDPSTPKRVSRPTNKQKVDEGALYAGGLYKSSMFKLQIDELLAEVRPNYEKRSAGLDEALHRLNGLIEAIEARPTLPISEATKLLQQAHKVTVPYPDPKPDKNAAYRLTYAKPSKINVVGSYALKTMLQSDVLSVDMVVFMPESIFQEKDFLNYRYFYKRAYYLACIAAGIQESAQNEFALRFEYLNGNSLHPILIAKLKSGASDNQKSKFEVQIIPAAPESMFAESKLRPTKNSIRPKQQESDSIIPGPSPFYNASLQSDCHYSAYLQLLHSASKQSSGFKDSCILGRIWLRQRGFGSSVANGGFGHFEWATLSALLLRGGGSKGHGVLSPGYSSYQMFKAVIQFLATSNLLNRPQGYEIHDFIPPKSECPMFYDGPRGLNILYKMTSWSYSLLQEEAKISIDMLNESTFDYFESTFIVWTVQPLQKYDSLVRVLIPEHTGVEFSSDHRSRIGKFSDRIFEVLREGLTDRVQLIDIKSPEFSSWSVRSPCPTAPDAKSLLVGVTFDPANINRLVDHGPPAEEKKKAAKFQKFWGEKAELRRFKDGSILESLVWSAGSTYSIFQEIFTYLIKRHFNPEISSSLEFTGQKFEKALPGSGSSTKLFDALNQAFVNFEKTVRDLEGLPLQLRQLSTISPQLRYSSIDLPSFDPRRPLKSPADVLIQFEGSGRWPDDVAAIQRTKIAFLLKIGNLLEEADDTISARLGLENEAQPLQNCAFLDISYQSGAAFRVRIHNDREQTLLERSIKDKITDHKTREEAVPALSIYKRTFIQLPLHTQSILTHCTRFPLLSPAIRLTKMWFNHHMLSRHISDELIELLVAHIFLQPFPWRSPSSAMTGFLRTLFFISRWDWRIVPLIVDFTGTMTSKEVSSINTRLEAWRKIDPGMNRTVILAASNHDITGTAFTEHGPSKMVAARMTALARSACKLVKEKGFDLNPTSLFTASISDYDFIIHLSPNYVANFGRKDSIKHKFKNIEVQSEADSQLISYEPIQMYFEELESLYTAGIVFFDGSMTSSIIAGLWNPQTLSPRAFKVNIAFATEPVVDTEEEEIKLDKEAILSEIARLGGDMVSRIEVH